jgi:signal peptidase I
LINRPRKTWIVGLLTLFIIGLGHVYYGEFKKGIILFAGWQLLDILCILSLLFYTPVGPIITVVALISYLIFCIADAAKGVQLHKLSYLLKPFNRWYFYILYWLIGTFVLTPIVEVTAKSYIAQTYRIPSGSMRDTLQDGDNIVVDKIKYKLSQPKRGDIAVFAFPEDPSKDFVDRIVALGGETLKIVNKNVYINGKMIDEPYVTHSESHIIPKGLQPRDNCGPVTIPEDSVFVMGDNRDQSYDSRFWGFVKKSSLKGRAKSICWSWDKEMFEVRWNRVGKKFQY